MTLTLAAARRLWESLPIPVDDGLTGAELRRVEEALGFEFNPDHRALLSAGLPLGDRWPDWRDGEIDVLRQRLAEPVEGVLFDVEENGFWWPGWGPRPALVDDAVDRARVELRQAPILVPLYGHRFSPALPQVDLPVLSVVQTDVIVYGRDLADYLRREFAGIGGDIGPVKTVPFWTKLA